MYLWSNRFVGDDFKDYDQIMNGQWKIMLLKGENILSSFLVILRINKL